MLSKQRDHFLKPALLIFNLQHDLIDAAPIGIIDAAQYIEFGAFHVNLQQVHSNDPLLAQHVRQPANPRRNAAGREPGVENPFDVA